MNIVHWARANTGVTLLILLTTGFTAGGVACTGDASIAELKCPKGTELRGNRPPFGNREYCGMPGPVPGGIMNHGPWRFWWPSGKRQQEGYYDKGAKHGKFTQWANGGEKIVEGRYEQNRKVGKWKRWSRSGKIRETTQYVDGRMHGFRRLYDRDGILNVELMYEAGEPMGPADGF